MEIVAKESGLTGRYRYGARQQASIQILDGLFDFGNKTSGLLGWLWQGVGKKRQREIFRVGHGTAPVAVSLGLSGTLLITQSGRNSPCCSQPPF